MPSTLDKRGALPAFPMTAMFVPAQSCEAVGTTLALYIEGTNTHAALRYDGGSQVVTGSTLDQVMLIPAERERQLEGWSNFPGRIPP
jgi:hypothetical protein